MSLTAQTQRRLDVALAHPDASAEVAAHLSNRWGTSWFVNTFTGSDSNTGKSWDQAFDTMSAALTAAATGDTIYFRGDVREELVGSNLKFDITIVGMGGKHHPDQPTSAYDPGAAMWRPPASPTTATNLLKVRGRGWTFINIAFDAPVDAAALYLERNALSDVSEYDASHATILGCRFLHGKYHIQDVGGCYNVTVKGNEFIGATTTSIVNTSTAVANPLNWKIIDNQFPSDNGDSFGNVVHIDSPLNSGIITGNTFGLVVSTGLYVDLTGGAKNVFSKNICDGEWDTSNYKGGTSDFWVGNTTAVDASTSAAGYSTAVPD